MYDVAKIKAYKGDEDSTQLIIELDKDIRYMIEERQVKSCGVHLDDGRTISVEQRKKAYATIKDIADFLGYLPEECKELLKYQYMSESGSEYFSLSDCTVTTAREFISSIMKFALEWDIPLSDTGVNRADDIGSYLYYCIKTRHCAVCGKAHSDIHHCEGSRVGMGQDRTKIDNSSRELICLCREHHSILHSMPEERFMNMHHIYGIRVKDYEEREDDESDSEREVSDHQ